MPAYQHQRLTAIDRKIQKEGRFEKGCRTFIITHRSLLLHGNAKAFSHSSLSNIRSSPFYLNANWVFSVSPQFGWVKKSNLNILPKETVMSILDITTQLVLIVFPVSLQSLKPKATPVLSRTYGNPQSGCCHYIIFQKVIDLWRRKLLVKCLI